VPSSISLPIPSLRHPKFHPSSGGSSQSVPLPARVLGVSLPEPKSLPMCQPILPVSSRRQGEFA